MEKEWIWGRGKVDGRPRKSGGKRIYGQDVLCERRINKQTNKKHMKLDFRQKYQNTIAKKIASLTIDSRKIIYPHAKEGIYSTTLLLCTKISS